MRKLAAVAIVVSLTALICIIKYSNTSFAQERIESGNYRIQFPNFNSGAGIPTSTNYNLDSTLGQGIAGEYSSTGYRVKAGFEYIHSIIPFSFAVSGLQINFGNLSPNTFYTGTSTITISAGGAGGYQVLASEDKPLTSTAGGNTIPNTVCDNSTCNYITAAVWTNTNTKGFGFNLSGDGVPSEFINSTYYKSFADRSDLVAPALLTSSTEAVDNHSTTVTYKVNILPTQAAGTYRNVVQYIAVPRY